MIPPACQLHGDTPPPRPERYEFTITEKGGAEKLITCKDHGQWVYEQAHGRNPKPEPPKHSNQQEIGKLKTQLADPNVTISRGERIREPIDQSPAGGGPGGRAMAPDLPPPPPPRPDRTYPGYDGGRLVVGSAGFLAAHGIQPGQEETSPNRLGIEWVIEPVCIVDLVLEVVGVVIVGHDCRRIPQHVRCLGAGPRVAQVSPPPFGDLRMARHDRFTPGRQCRVRAIPAFSQVFVLSNDGVEVSGGVVHGTLTGSTTLTLFPRSIHVDPPLPPQLGIGTQNRLGHRGVEVLAVRKRLDEVVTATVRGVAHGS